jgi:hypothetical protein
MRLQLLPLITALLAVDAESSFATTIALDFYVDDRASVSMDGVLLGSYNNPAAAGSIDANLNLAPGWHDISISYANQAGTNFLNFAQQYAGDSGFSTVPRSNLQSTDQTGLLISGLRADYYTSLGGAYLFTVYGEGPIRHGATSFSDELYQGVTGLWAGRVGPSSDFGEVLTGQFLVSGPELGPAPEPSTAVLFGLAAALLWAGSRGRRVALRGWSGR